MLTPIRPPNSYFREATAADRSRLISLVNAAYSIETFLEGTRTDERAHHGHDGKGNDPDRRGS